MKKHLGFLIMNFENGGGTERVTSMISSGLVQRNYQVTVISCQKGHTCRFELDPRVRMISLEGEKISNPLWRKVQMEKNLSKVVRDDKIDVLIAVDVSLYLYLLPLQKRCKCIAWEHFNYYIQPNALVRLARKLSTRYADCIVVLGKKDLENYRKNSKKIKRIEYIYNPIAVSQENTADIGKKRILAVGRLEDQKGFDLLIKAWALLEKKYPDWKLDIFGDGSKKQLLETQIQNQNLHNIHLCGYAKSIEEEFLTSSIFVLSSRYEGFVLVLLEAQAKGLPCVSFNCKEGPGEIIDDGINGFLVEPENYSQLAEKTELLMKNENLRQEFSQKARKDLARFDTKNVLDQWESLIDSL